MGEVDATLCRGRRPSSVVVGVLRRSHQDRARGWIVCGEETLGELCGDPSRV